MARKRRSPESVAAVLRRVESGITLEEAARITAMGKDERAIAAGPYVIAGGIKITEEAWNTTAVHKGRSANHLVMQISNFRLGSKDTDGLDLLDCFGYLVSVTHGTASGERKGI